MNAIILLLLSHTNFFVAADLVKSYGMASRQKNTRTIKIRKAPQARNNPHFVTLSLLPAAGVTKKKEYVKSALKDGVSRKSIKEIGADVFIDIQADGEVLNDKRGDNADGNLD